MRTVHRITSLFVVVVTLYLGATGTLIQLIDLTTLFRHAPATDPNMMALREDKDGPGDFEVLGTAEYTAPSLPAGFYVGQCAARLRRPPHGSSGSFRTSSVRQARAAL
jgi:hypothetical protein